MAEIEGQIVTPPFGYGGEPGEKGYERCQGKCRGNERFRGESPARYGTTGDGKRVIWCPCCNTQLTPAKPGKTGLQPGTEVQLAALSPEVKSQATVWTDTLCRYDVISMKEIVATGDKV